MSVYENMVARYESGELPWDDALPPPEVIDLVKQLAIGRALDLGCGPGRTSIYLAQQGWQVDGVDFVAKAIEIAMERARIAQVKPQFYCASVTALDFLTGPYDLAIDIGCGHSLDSDQLRHYHAHLKRLIRPNGLYLLFARLKQPQFMEDELPRGLDEPLFQQLFEDGFVQENRAYGETHNSDGSSWASVWVRFRRQN